MKLGVCPCCASNKIKKIEGTEFVCQSCLAPLRFTWKISVAISIIMCIFFPWFMQKNLPAYMLYGVPLLFIAAFFLFYFKFRRFYFDQFRCDELKAAAETDLKAANQFMAGELGALDFIERVDDLKTLYGSNPNLNAALQDHFNRVGGLTAQSQAEVFAQSFPAINLLNHAQQIAQEAQARLNRLQTYDVPAALRYNAS